MGMAKTPIAGPIQAEVIRVIDGDTLLVKAHIWLNQVVETRVRLSGIDTPEKRGACPNERALALKAEEMVRDSAGPSSMIILTNIKADKYGSRVIAKVTTPSGQDLAQLLTVSGLAVPYDGGKKSNLWCSNSNS